MLTIITESSRTEVGQYGISKETIARGELVHNDQYLEVRPLTVMYAERAYQSNQDDTHGIYTENGSLYTTAKEI
jgi:hypothetical protein